MVMWVLRYKIEKQLSKQLIDRGKWNNVKGYVSKIHLLKTFIYSNLDGLRRHEGNLVCGRTCIHISS